MHRGRIRCTLSAFALSVLVLQAGCGEDDEIPSVDPDAGDTGTTADTAVDDAGDVDGDGGTCRPRIRRIDCRDLAEWSVATRWSAGPSDADVSFAVSRNAIFGERAARLRAGDADRALLTWRPDEPIDIRPASGSHAVIRAAVRAKNSNPSGWQGETPTVTLRDSDGGAVELIPANGNAELLPGDGASWRWLSVPVALKDGWRTRIPGESPADAVDLSAIEAVEFEFESWRTGFTVDLDGLAFTGNRSACRYECPENCNGRGTCAPAQLRCRCELGAVGRSCGRCGEGFERTPDGGCELADDGDYDTWPNPVSDTTGDAWLRAHHQEVEVLEPRVLVLNFANRSSMSAVEELVDQIVEGFELASRPASSDGSGEPQLQYRVEKIVDMRNGRAGNPPAPEGWSRDNSTLFPRKRGPFGGLDFDYAEMFSRDFARHYGYDAPRDESRHLRLCELIERGNIHDVWIVGAHSENDAVPNEVVEYKQRYTRRGNAIPGSFSPCAGNGCFEIEDPPCDRSVRIGFINYKRGPGCYLHNIGHLMEWLNSHRVVPGYSRWFDRFAGMDLNERYDVPFESLYGVDCNVSPCIRHPDAETLEVRHGGETYTLEDWDNVCGNTHFPPNGSSHYDYENDDAVRSTCNGFGRRAVSCRQDATEKISQTAWRSLRSRVPDCGGGFLVWWYRRMPAHGTPHRYPDGSPMKSVWPFLFY